MLEPLKRRFVLEQFALSLTVWHRTFMGIAYSRDLRERSVQAVNDGMAPSEVARIFRVSVRSLRRWRQLEATTGDLMPRPHPGRPPKLSAAHRAAVREHVAQHPDATLGDRVAWVAATHDVQVSVATMSRLMQTLGFSFNKRARSPRSSAPSSGTRGASGRGRSIPPASSSSMKPAPRPH